MSNTVIQVDLTTMQQIKTAYTPFLKEKVPQGGVFSAKLPTCSITAYKSGKILFQGGNHETEAAKWGSPVAATKTVRSSEPVSNSFLSTLSAIGSDEVGTGDYFGPITVVASFVDKSLISELQQLGIKDSKQLTDEKIILLAKKLIKIIPYSVQILRNEKYNDIQATMSQGKMKALLHNKALIQLLEKISPIKPEAIIIDQFAVEKTYYNYLRGQSTIVKENVHFATKAESLHLAVASSSIIARYAFLKEMDTLSEKAGVTLPKGAATQVDRVAAQLMEKGVDLHGFAKLHFANTEKAKKMKK